MNHEEELVKAFIVPAKRGRYVEMVTKIKLRPKFLRELGHFKGLDLRRMVAIVPNQQNPTDICTLLRKMGAPSTCWVTSENSEIDATEMPLFDALNQVVGRQMGTFLSCIPGKLAYFEDEDGRCLLEGRP